MPLLIDLAPATVRRGHEYCLLHARSRYVDDATRAHFAISRVKLAPVNEAQLASDTLQAGLSDAINPFPAL